MSELSQKEQIQQKILRDIIIMMDVKRLPGELTAENRKNISKFKDAVLVAKVKQLGTLGLPQDTDLVLNYTEKKAVSHYVGEKLRTVYADDLKEMEQVLKSQKLEDEIMKMYHEREAIAKEIEEVARTKIKLLKEVVSMRVTPEKAKLVDNLAKEAKLNALKILYMEKALSSKLANTTSNFPAALKEIEENLLKIVEQNQHRTT